MAVDYLVHSAFPIVHREKQWSNQAIHPIFVVVHEKLDMMCILISN